jgi:eukaryotic-like serine/threonine-protein kinase
MLAARLEVHAMTAPAPNQLVAPNLKLVARLGEGGMGSVWLADHLTLHTHVVVKFMSQELATSAVAIARFSREAETAAQVRSPHVVQMFDHGVTDAGVPYIVMELLEGMDLGHHLDLVGRMSPGEVATLVTQMASALTRAHKLGIIHRDIKPENVFLTDLGNDELFVKVLDFGIARGRSDRLTRVTREGVFMGTPQYMSPESLINPDAVSTDLDLWALAAVAFEAITGERPFAGETIAALTLQMHAVIRPAASLFVPDLPPALDEWFARAFALDPKKRFPDARTMAETFVAAQQAEPIRRTRPPPEPKVRRDTARLGLETLALAENEPTQEPQRSTLVPPSTAAIPLLRSVAPASGALGAQPDGAVQLTTRDFAIEPTGDRSSDARRTPMPEMVSQSGIAVVQPAPPMVASEPSRRTPWLLVAASIVAIVVIAFALRSRTTASNGDEGASSTIEAPVAATPRAEGTMSAGIPNTTPSAGTSDLALAPEPSTLAVEVAPPPSSKTAATLAKTTKTAASSAGPTQTKAPKAPKLRKAPAVFDDVQ